jgi:hypothetical protein
VRGELDWEHLADAFAAIADLPADQQAAALARCADPALRDQLTAMLAAEPTSDHPLDQSVESAARDLIGAAPSAPRRIGPY